MRRHDAPMRLLISTSSSAIRWASSNAKARNSCGFFSFNWLPDHPQLPLERPGKIYCGRAGGLKHGCSSLQICIKSRRHHEQLNSASRQSQSKSRCHADGRCTTYRHILNGFGYFKTGMQRDHFQRSRQAALIDQAKSCLSKSQKTVRILYTGKNARSRALITARVYHAGHGFASIDTASFLNYKDCYAQKTIVCRFIGNTAGGLRSQPGSAPSHRNAPSKPSAGCHPDGYRLTHCNPYRPRPLPKSAWRPPTRPFSTGIILMPSCNTKRPFPTPMIRQ